MKKDQLYAGGTPNESAQAVLCVQGYMRHIAVNRLGLTRGHTLLWSSQLNQLMSAVRQSSATFAPARSGEETPG